MSHTTSVVLWLLLVYQRLNPKTSLAGAVKHLLDTAPQTVPLYSVIMRRGRQTVLSSDSGIPPASGDEVFAKPLRRLGSIKIRAISSGFECATASASK